MDSSVWWMAFLRLNHKAHTPSKTPTKASVAALGQSSQYAIGDTSIFGGYFLVDHCSACFTICPAYLLTYLGKAQLHNNQSALQI